MSNAATPVEREDYSAKQVATKLGTDAKTLRKFFRSSASSTKAVGFGGRYIFKPEDIQAIETEFKAWVSNKAPRGRRPSGRKVSASRGAAIEVLDEMVDGFDDFEDLEPDEADLIDLEKDLGLSEFDDPADDDYND